MEPRSKSLLQKSLSARREKRGKILSQICAWSIIFSVALIIFFLAFKGSLLFYENHVKLANFVFGTKWQPTTGSYGALPLIIGSSLVSFASVILCAPLAIGAAVMMSEIVSPKIAGWLKIGMEVLVGIPAVIYGLLGILLIVPGLRWLFGGTGYGWLAAAIVLAVMILPTLVSLSLDAFNGVPQKYRQAAYALGATKLQVWSTIVAPMSVPRLKTALIFSFSQAFGEAIAVQMVVGNAALFPTSINSPAATLTSVITIGLADAVPGSEEINALWSLAFVLLLMSLIFNLIAHYLIWRRKHEF